MAYSEAQQATYNATVESLAILDRIRAKLAAEQEALRQGASRHWGDAGSAEHWEAALREIAHQMFNEGEYAHTACLRCGGSYATGGDANDHAAHAAYERERVAR